MNFDTSADVVLNDFTVESIKPLVSNDILKTVLDEVNKIIEKIALRFNLSPGDVGDYVKDDLTKICVKLGIKKRNRRVLSPDKQCMGRKLDGNQCTRGRYKPGCDYCKSHANKLPLGRIDDEYVQKEPSQRGRKRKTDKKSMEYIMTKIETIGDTNYLIDERNMVYSFDTKAPQFLGIKVDGQVKTLADLGIKVF